MVCCSLLQHCEAASLQQRHCEPPTGRFIVKRYATAVKQSAEDEGDYRSAWNTISRSVRRGAVAQRCSLRVAASLRPPRETFEPQRHKDTKGHEEGLLFVVSSFTSSVPHSLPGGRAGLPYHTLLTLINPPTELFSSFPWSAASTKPIR
jgi:hypothetical protein